MSNKKICSTVCLSLVMTAGAVPATAQSEFFIVGNVGNSATKFSPTPLPAITDKEQSFELGIGYAFNPYFAIQASYQDFGQATETLELECPPGASCLQPEDCPPQSVCFIAVAPLLMQADIRGWSARLSGSFPFGGRFAGFASVGVIAWDAPVDFILPPGTQVFVADHEDSGEDLIYEAGLRWHVSPRWSLQVSYEEVNLDIESTKIGAMFRF